MEETNLSEKSAIVILACGALAMGLMDLPELKNQFLDELNQHPPPDNIDSYKNAVAKIQTGFTYVLMQGMAKIDVALFKKYSNDLTKASMELIDGYLESIKGFYQYKAALPPDAYSGLFNSVGQITQYGNKSLLCDAFEVNFWIEAELFRNSIAAGKNVRIKSPAVVNTMIYFAENAIKELNGIPTKLNLFH